ncbi:hemolysin family protein [Catenuloplanes atrovinosus]|uniref:CBS domain containing-hemolysin-like protein n=1 Tax=Catenuloplanes atrovinosus TaxID=137266 RepID=A0AAE3YJ68_9ACTN|nr:hemolysin family protein [Catenuloplanes atrovinosus]MDR7273437.1 CBS domain containing-hemolysin-like protein [Catenuloplanes atrovinosus]
MSTGWAVTLSLLLLAGNAFFVAAEFALIASKRYRLEQAAAGGGAADRAALAGSRELTVMLAGAQLGITLCSLGLGALAEPAIEHLVSPLLHQVGLPDAPSHVIAFLFALTLVTFLHLVLGEMMPKSWAISHPENSARLLALPFRGFTRVVRPILTGLNSAANAVLRLFRIEPQNELAQVHDPEELRMLLEQSREHGTLPVDQHALLTSMLALQRTTVAEIATPAARMVSVAPGDTAYRIEQVSHATGRSRLAVIDPDAPGVLGMVHVRDAVRVTAGEEEAVTAAELMSPPFTLRADETLMQAVGLMRAERAQLALVSDAGATVGFVALEDLLEEVIGEFDDETDEVPRGRRLR